MYITELILTLTVTQWSEPIEFKMACLIFFSYREAMHHI